MRLPARTAVRPPPPSEGAEERKVVSVLFADLAGFIAGSDGADPEDVKARLRPYFARAREIELRRYRREVHRRRRGRLVRRTDVARGRRDPSRAGGLADHPCDRRAERGGPDARAAIRIAVDTGEVVVDVDSSVERGEGIATGDVMNTASRLQHEAPVGGVVVGERTYRLTAQSFEYEPLGPVSVKGKLALIPIWRVLGLRSSLSGRHSRR